MPSGSAHPVDAKARRSVYVSKGPLVHELQLHLAEHIHIVRIMRSKVWSGLKAHGTLFVLGLFRFVLVRLFYACSIPFPPVYCIIIIYANRDSHSFEERK